MYWHIYNAKGDPFIIQLLNLPSLIGMEASVIGTLVSTVLSLHVFDTVKG